MALLTVSDRSSARRSAACQRSSGTRMARDLIGSFGMASAYAECIDKRIYATPLVLGEIE